MEGKRTLGEEQVCATSATQCPRGAASKWQRLPRLRVQAQTTLVSPGVPIGYHVAFFRSTSADLSLRSYGPSYLSCCSLYIQTLPLPLAPNQITFFLGFSTKPSSLGEYRGFPGVSALKNPPAVRKKTRVRSLGWEDSLAKGTAILSTLLVWEILWTGAWRRTVYGVSKSRTRLSG